MWGASRRNPGNGQLCRSDLTAIVQQSAARQVRKALRTEPADDETHIDDDDAEDKYTHANIAALTKKFRKFDNRVHSLHRVFDQWSYGSPS